MRPDRAGNSVENEEGGEQRMKDNRITRGFVGVIAFVAFAVGYGAGSSSALYFTNENWVVAYMVAAKTWDGESVISPERPRGADPAASGLIITVYGRERTAQAAAEEAQRKHGADLASVEVVEITLREW